MPQRVRAASDWRGCRDSIAGFTLVELLVVISIMALLMSILMPVLSRSRDAAMTVKCASNLRQLGLALSLYCDDHGGQLPAWSGWHVYPDGTSPQDEPGLGWTEQLAPELKVAPDSRVYDCPAFDPDVPMNYFLAGRWAYSMGRHNLKLAEIHLSTQYIMSGDCTNRAEYAPPFGTNRNTTVDCDKDDALMELLLFADRPGGMNAHKGGNNILFADGHVAHFLTFDPTAMTYHGREMRLWSEVHP